LFCGFAIFCDLCGEVLWGFESALWPDAVNEVHRHPLWGSALKFAIEQMCFYEHRVLVAESYGLADAEYGVEAFVLAADVIFSGAEEDAARVDAILRDNLRGHLHIQCWEAELLALSPPWDDLADKAIWSAEEHGGVGNVAALEHIADCGA
jgi:hypothetical protein